ncbi:---NA--- [Paramuricea clavata]|uniref:---NA n=1 Tax=Paramuricea clavata TaxID=317549 RepID=A0A7D9J5G7_PARCT|nr:---NA--- [Paramuricea clavata]
MAPTGQETQQIRDIDDLDSADTNGKKLKRNKSINNTAVLVAKCVAEHDDLNPRETTNTGDKLQSETEVVLEDGSLAYVCLPVIDIPCLGGVEASAKTSTLDSASAWDQSLDQSFQTKNPPRTWRSSGKGKKRKKPKAGSKKKIYKKHKTDVSMPSSNESLESFVSNKNTFADTEVPFVFCGAQPTNCKITTGGRKHNNGTKGGRIATQQTCGSVKASNKMCSDVQSHRGGGGGGDGDDGDDGNKPPRKPPDAVLCCKTTKQRRKKKKTKSSEMEVDGGSNEGGGDCPPSSANDQEMVSVQKEQVVNEQIVNVPCVQPEQPRQPTKQLLLMLHKRNTDINHNNYCGKTACDRCSEVETKLIRHYFDEMNGSCKCNECQLWSLVLKYHTSKCQIKICKVCMRAKKTLQKPAPAAAVIQKNELNVPMCGQSLDEDDLIVWKVYIKLHVHSNF